MTGAPVRVCEGEVCDLDLPTRIDAVECSLDVLHDKVDIVLAALDDMCREAVNNNDDLTSKGTRDNKCQTRTTAE